MKIENWLTVIAGAFGMAIGYLVYQVLLVIGDIVHYLLGTGL